MKALGGVASQAGDMAFTYGEARWTEPGRPEWATMPASGRNAAKAGDWSQTSSSRSLSLSPKRSPRTASDGVYCAATGIGRGTTKPVDRVGKLIRRERLGEDDDVVGSRDDRLRCRHSR